MKSKQRKILTLDAIIGVVAGIAGAITALMSAFIPGVWKDFSAFISGFWEICQELLQGPPSALVVGFICLFGVCPGLIIGLCFGLIGMRNRPQSVIRVIIRVGITVFLSALCSWIAGLVLGFIGGLVTGLLY